MATHYSEAARFDINNRLFTHIIKTKKCWLWKRHVNKDGYGRIRWGEKRVPVHRLFYELFKGKITDGLLVCHHCDVPSCVRPSHLFLGTNKDNMVDACKKGIIKTGERSHRSKITDMQAKTVKRLRRWNTPKAISELLGIPRTTIYHILYRHSWKYL